MAAPLDHCSQAADPASTQNAQIPHSPSLRVQVKGQHQRVRLRAALAVSYTLPTQTGRISCLWRQSLAGYASSRHHPMLWARLANLVCVELTDLGLGVCPDEVEVLPAHVYQLLQAPLLVRAHWAVVRQARDHVQLLQRNLRARAAPSHSPLKRPLYPSAPAS